MISSKFGYLIDKVFIKLIIVQESGEADSVVFENSEYIVSKNSLKPCSAYYINLLLFGCSTISASFIL